jgi:hypothetical protein
MLLIKTKGHSFPRFFTDKIAGDKGFWISASHYIGGITDPFGGFEPHFVFGDMVPIGTKPIGFTIAVTAKKGREEREKKEFAQHGSLRFLGFEEQNLSSIILGYFPNATFSACFRLPRQSW